MLKQKNFRRILAFCKKACTKAPFPRFTASLGGKSSFTPNPADFKFFQSLVFHCKVHTITFINSRFIGVTPPHLMKTPPILPRPWPQPPFFPVTPDTAGSCYPGVSSAWGAGPEPRVRCKEWKQISKRRRHMRCFQKVLALLLPRSQSPPRNRQKPAYHVDAVWRDVHRAKATAMEAGNLETRIHRSAAEAPCGRHQLPPQLCEYLPPIKKN